MWQFIDKILISLEEFSILEFFWNLYFVVGLLVVVSIILLRLYTKTKNALKNAEHYLDVMRTVSKAISKYHEIAAFNDTGDIVYTTHPRAYSSKNEFFRHLLGKVVASPVVKNFCKLFDSKKPANVLLTGSGSGLQNQFRKWSVTGDFVSVDDSNIGEAISVISVSDITKHFNEVERAIVHYERLERLLDHFPVGIFYVNNSGKIVGANVTFANLISSSKDRILDLDITDFIDVFNSEVAPQKPMLVTVKPKFAPMFEAVLIKAQSTASLVQPWVIYKLKILPNQPPENESEFINQETFMLAHLPAVVIDQNGGIQAINPAFANMIQDKIILDKKKIMKPGVNIADFIKLSSSDNSTIEILRQAKALTEKISPVELNFINSNVVVMGYTSILSNGKFFLLQLVDISSQKILEQQFIQSQKMQAIGQLAGGIAHDFNNLLTAMIGFCDLLLQRYTPKDPSYSDVVQIKQNAGRAANLVRQLLAFSRQQTLKPNVASVSELLVDISSLLRRLIGANIDLQVIHEQNIWLTKVDQGQFEQIIINLAVNARDAMENNGKLIIRTKNYFTEQSFKCVYDTAPPGDYVLIEVVDTGCGIPRDLIENIFEPFFSKKVDDSGKKHGTGLGLSTVYGIVNQTGGFIDVESEVEKGSNFKVFFPRYTGNEKIKSTERQTVIKDLSGSETILLVEDEDAVRKFSARALGDKGYKVLEAANGEEAIEIAKINNFDLLITDVVMPKIDGPMLCKILNDLKKNLKTIFISGYTEDTFRQNVGKDSTIHFLQKPFTLKDLAGKVKEVLSGVE